MISFQSILNQISIVACFQGFLHAAGLFFINEGDKILNIILRIYLMCLSLTALYSTLYCMGYYGKYSAILCFNFPTDFIGNAVIYLFVFWLINLNYNIYLTTIFHFNSAILILTYYANYYFSAIHVKQEIIQRRYYYFPYVVAFLSFLDIIYSVICILIDAVIFQHNKKQASEFYSDYEWRNQRIDCLAYIIKCSRMKLHSTVINLMKTCNRVWDI